MLPDLLSPQFADALERLARCAERMPGGGLLGDVLTGSPGSGPEWRGHRDYSPGDDFHAIDWRLCARTDELLTRVFDDRPDPRVDVLVDVSPSMGLGRPAKLDLAVRAAAALARVSASRLARVGVTTFSDRLLDSSAQIRGSGQFGRVARFLAAVRPAERHRPTDLIRCVEELARLRRRPGLVVLISDLFDPEGLAAALETLVGRGEQVRVLHVLDPRDAEPPSTGDLAWSDVETGASGELTVTEHVARAYRTEYALFLDRGRRAMAARGVAWVEITMELADRPDELLWAALGGRGLSFQQTSEVSETSEVCPSREPPAR